MKLQVKFPITVYFIWYLIILLFQIFIQTLYKATSDSLTLYQRLYLSWATYWDSGHYVTIAEQGYNYPQQAFFPLWPLLIKIFSYIVGFYNASFILSIFFGLMTFILFYLLAVKLMGSLTAKYALILFAVFPSTFFLHAGYTEGLFLSLTLLSFLFLDWFFSLVFLLMLIPVFKKLRFQYFLYSSVVILLPLSASNTPGIVRAGMIRYVLIAFPVFFVAPQVIRSKILLFLLSLLLLLLELRFVAFFTGRAWVA